MSTYLTQKEHGAAIAAAMRLTGKDQRYSKPVRIELTDKGVIAHGGQRLCAYVRFDAPLNVKGSTLLNAAAVRDILKLSRKVELVLGKHEVVLKNGCTWSLVNHAPSETVYDVKPVNEVARIPATHLRAAIKAAYKRHGNSARSKVRIGRNLALKCRDLELLLGLPQVKGLPDSLLNLSVWKCENNRVRYGIPFVAWIAGPWESEWPLTYGEPYPYAVKWESGSHCGVESMLDAWRYRDQNCTLHAFWGFTKEWKGWIEP